MNKINLLIAFCFASVLPIITISPVYIGDNGMFMAIFIWFMFICWLLGLISDSKSKDAPVEMDE